MNENIKSHRLLPKLTSKKAPESLQKKIKFKRSEILKRIEEKHEINKLSCQSYLRRENEK